MSQASVGIELAFREIVASYDNLLKLVHDLQDLLNDKEKLKLDMFNDIDVVLKRVNDYFSLNEKSQRQGGQLKRELQQRNYELELYRERQLHLIGKVNALQAMNNRLLDAMEQTFKRKLVKDRPKQEEPMVVAKGSRSDLRTELEPTSTKKLENCRDHLLRSSARVYKFFQERLRHSERDTDVQNEQKTMEKLLARVKGQASQDYELLEKCDGLLNRIKKLSEEEVKFSNVLSRMNPLQEEKFDWQAFNQELELQAEAYDHKSTIQRVRYLYWSECDLFLLELQTKLPESDLKKEVDRVLLTSKLLSRTVYDTALDYSGFEDCLLRYRMSCEQMAAAKELQQTDKEQTYIPLLKDTVLHEKSLINQLARTFEETNKHIVDNKITFNECFEDIVKHSKAIEEELKDREQKIKNLERQLDDKRQALEMSINEGETSMYRRSRRRRMDDSIMTHRHAAPEKNSIIIEAEDVLETEKKIQEDRKSTQPKKSEPEMIPPKAEEEPTPTKTDRQALVRKASIQRHPSKPPRKLSLAANVVNEKVSTMTESGFSFQVRNDKSSEEDMHFRRTKKYSDEIHLIVEEPNETDKAEHKLSKMDKLKGAEARSSYIRMSELLESKVKAMAEQEETIRRTIQRMRDLRSQFSDVDGPLPQIHLKDETLGDVSNVVINSFRLMKRDKDKPLAEFFADGDISPVVAVKDRKAFGVYVSEVEQGFGIDPKSEMSGELQKEVNILKLSDDRLQKVPIASDFLKPTQEENEGSPHTSQVRYTPPEQSREQTLQQKHVRFHTSSSVHAEIQTTEEIPSPQFPRTNASIQTDQLPCEEVVKPIEAPQPQPQIVAYEKPQTTDAQCQTIPQNRSQILAASRIAGSLQESINFEFSEMQPSSGSNLKKEPREGEELPASYPSMPVRAFQIGSTVQASLIQTKLNTTPVEIEHGPSELRVADSVIEDRSKLPPTDKSTVEVAVKLVTEENIENLGEMRKAKLLQLHDIEKRIYCLTEREEPNEHLDRSSEKSGKEPPKFHLDLSKAIKMPLANEFLTFRDERYDREKQELQQRLEQHDRELQRYEREASEKDSAFVCLKRQYDHIFESKQQLQREVDELRQRLEALNTPDTGRPEEVVRVIPPSLELSCITVAPPAQLVHSVQLEVPPIAGLDESAVSTKRQTIQLKKRIAELTEQVHQKDKQIASLQRRIADVTRSCQVHSEELRAVKARLEQSRDLQQRVRSLTEDNADYARRMVENSPYIAKLEIEVKDLTLQLEQLQQQTKDRVIRQQEWIRKVLENEQFQPLDTTANEAFLQMVFAMHEKIRHQEGEIKNMVDEFQLSAQDSASQMEEMRKQLLKSLPTGQPLALSK